MHTLKRCTGADTDFRAMVASLDEELNSRYGAQMEFFGPHNHSADVQQALVIYADGLPVGCGCFKPFSADSVEMKRIFVLSAYRGRRLARALMAELTEQVRHNPELLKQLEEASLTAAEKVVEASET